MINDIEQLIKNASDAFELAEKAEKDNGYADALLSMDRTYCQGYLDALQDVRLLVNAGYND